MATQEYAPGRALTVLGAPHRGIALLWHGRGIDHRTSMVPLAERIAAGGVLALAADWDSEADDGGRADLLTSLRHARETAEHHDLDPASVVVVGWSLGGTAALSVAVHAKRLGIELGAAVLVAPGDGARVTDPISGSPLPHAFPPGTGRCPIHLAYGLDDPLATPDLVTGLELRLRAADWRTTLHEVDADHASVVGTRFDPVRETYPRSGSPRAVAAVQAVADVVVTAVADAVVAR